MLIVNISHNSLSQFQFTQIRIKKIALKSPEKKKSTFNTHNISNKKFIVRMFKR